MAHASRKTSADAPKIPTPTQLDPHEPDRPFSEITAAYAVRGMIKQTGMRMSFLSGTTQTIAGTKHCWPGDH